LVAAPSGIGQSIRHAIVTIHAGGNESRFHGFRAEVDELSIMGSGQHEIVEQLGLMIGGERLHGFQFVDRTLINQHVEEIGFHEASVNCPDLHLALAGDSQFVATVSEFTLVNPFVTKLAERILQLESNSHQDTVQSMESFAPNRPYLN
jgi:hypothetical protein